MWARGHMTYIIRAVSPNSRLNPSARPKLAWEIGVQHKLLGYMTVCIEQDIEAQSKIVVKIVLCLRVRVMVRCFVVTFELGLGIELGLGPGSGKFVS